MSRVRWRGSGCSRIVSVAVIAVAACGPACADVVTLKDGRTVRGKIVERRPTEIVLEVPYGRMTIEHARITSIREESDVDRLVAEGHELAATGQYEKAIERYRLALAHARDETASAAVRRKVVLAYRNLAHKRIAAGDAASAERALRALLRLAPGDEEATKSIARLRALRARVGDILERADLLFDIGAYGESITQYRRVLALAPERAGDVTARLIRAHTEAGNAYFVRQRYPGAAVHFLRALRLAEKAPTSRPRVGLPPVRPTRAVYEVRKRWAYAVLVPTINRINSGTMRTVDEWRLAAAAAQRVALETPEVPHVHFVLGLCHEALSHPAGALAAYARITGDPVGGDATPDRAQAAREKAHRVVRKDPVRVMVATKDQRWLAVSPGDWQTVTTDHFVVFHRNPFIAGKVARAAEYWYKAIIVHWTAPGTYSPWSRKCSIYLYPTRKAFQEATSQPDWVPAVSHVLVREGALRDHRLSTYQTVRLLNESILPHELTHILFPQLVGYPQTFPRWIHECTALLEEPDYKRHRFREAMRTYLKAEVALDLKRLMAISEHPKGDEAQRFYAQCHAIAEFLLQRGGRTRFLAFARAAVKDGGEKALLATYAFKDLDEFDRAWRRRAAARGE